MITDPIGISVHEQSTESYLIDHFSDALFALSRDERFHYVNLEAERLLKRPRHELLGKRIWDEFPERLGSSFHNAYHRILHEDEAASFEEFYSPLKAWFQVHALSINSDRLLCFRDVSRYKQDDLLFQQTEYDPEEIIDPIKKPVICLCRDLRVKYASRSFYQLFDLAAEETLNVKIDDLGNGRWNSPPLVALLDGVLLHDERIEGFELDHDSPGVGSKTIKVNARKVYRRSDDAELILLEFDDITHHELAERETRDNAACLQRLLDANTIGILFAKGTAIVDGNDFVLEMLGYSREDLAAHRVHWDEITPPEYAEVDQIHVAESFGTGRGTPYEKEFIRKDGSRVSVLIGMTLLKDDPAEWLCFVLDLTEKKRAEADLMATYQREHQIAESLRQSLLTMPLEHSFGGLAVKITYEPASGEENISNETQVGGDFTDGFTLSDGNIVLIVGDVVGKGLVASTHVAEVKYALRAFLCEHGKGDVALERLNEFFYASQQEESKRGNEILVSLVAVIVDPRTGDMSITSAGMEPPLIVHKNGEMVEVVAKGPPLGVVSTAGYAPVSSKLDAGDLLVIATDGITEAKGMQGYLGYDGMKELVRKAVPVGSLRKMGRMIVDDARAFAGGKLQDDACLMIARRE